MAQCEDVAGCMLGRICDNRGRLIGRCCRRARVDIEVEGCLRRDATTGLVGRKYSSINISSLTFRATESQQSMTCAVEADAPRKA